MTPLRVARVDDGLVPLVLASLTPRILSLYCPNGLDEFLKHQIGDYPRIPLLSAYH